MNHLNKMTSSERWSSSLAVLRELFAGFWQMWQQLEELVGPQLAAAVMQHAGRNGGVAFARATVASGTDAPLAVIQGCLAAFEAVGLGHATLLDPGFLADGAADTVPLRIQIDETFEGQALGDVLGGEPRCAYTAGALAGIVATVTGRNDVIAVEQTCQVSGDATCIFDLRPTDVEGLPVHPLMRETDAEDPFALLPALLDRFPLGIAFFDRDYRLQSCNLTWKAMIARNTSTRLEDVTCGETLFDLAPGTASRLRPLLKRVLVGELLSREELSLESGGHRFYWDVLWVPIFVGDAVTGVVAVTRDVTAQVTLDQRLEDVQQRLEAGTTRVRLVLEATQDGIWDWNIATGEIYFSPRWKSMLGYEPDELPDDLSVWEQRLHPDDVDRALAAVKAHLAGETDVFELEHRLRHKDGSYRWILARGVSQREPDGRRHKTAWGTTTVRRFVGAHTDITLRKESEQQLQHLFAFQNVITETSTRFINLAPDEVDAGIDQALATVGRFMGVDRSYLFLFSGNKMTMSCVQEWCAPGVAPQQRYLQDVPTESLPWSNSQLLEEKVLHIPDVSALPLEAEPERREFEAQGIRSLLAVPMAYRGDVIGFLGFDAVRERKTWSEEARTLLKTVGEIFVNALEHKRAQAIQAGQRQFLELLARGGDFTATLETLIRLIEEQWPGMVGLVLLFDQEEGRLHHGASLSLSSAYLDTIEGLEIGPRAGSCGTAAYREERVIVEDITSDPRWDGLREAALLDGLQACWSQPIFSSTGDMLGTFAMYYRYPRRPSEAELDTIEMAAYLAGVAIERQRSEEALRESQRMLSTLMSNLPGMAYRCRNDARWTMQFVSEGALDLTGYPPDDLVDNQAVAYRELILPEDRQQVRDAVEDAIASRESFQVTYRITTRGGDQIWVWEQGQAVFDQQDEFVALEGFVIDITERVMAEQVLERRVEARTQDIERRRQVAESLRDILAVLNANRPLESVVKRIVVQARNLLKADGCALYRIDRERGETVAEGWVGMPPEFAEDLLHFPWIASAPQQAVADRRPYPMADIPASYGDLEVEADKSSKIRRWMRIISEHFRSKLTVPVVVKDEVYAGMELYYAEQRHFSPEDVDLALAFSDQAGLAIENARLYHALERRAEESQALFNVQQAITSDLEMDAVLQMITEEARRITGVERAVVLLLDESGERLVIRHVAGGNRPGLVGEWLSVQESISGRSMLAGEPVLVTDMLSDPRVETRKREDIRFRSQISVPLLTNSGPLGIIAISDPEPHFLSQDDVHLMMMLASSAVVGLENARLYQQEQERRAESEERRRVAEGLRDILAVLNSNRSFEQVLDYIVDQASALLGANAGVIYRGRQGADTVVVEAASGAPEELLALREFPNLPETVNQSIARQEPFAVSDLSEMVDTDLPGGVETLPEALVRWKEIIRSHYRAYIAVPLLIKDDLYGALTLYYLEPRDFSQEDIELAEALGGQVALAVESAHLYAETRRRADETQALLSVQQAITSRLDPDMVLQMIADEARRLTEAEQGAVYILQDDELEIAVVSGDVSPDMVGYRLPLDGSVAGLAVTSGEPFLVTGAQEDDRVHKEIIREVGADSFIIVPLLTGEGALGTITVANKRAGQHFDDEDSRVLTLMASSAAIALENARLYREEQERRAEAERRRRVAEGLRGILTILNSARPLAEILDYIVGQAGKLLGAAGGVIYRLDEKTERLHIEAACQMPEDFAKLKSLPVMLTPVNRAVLEERVPYGVSDVAMSLERMSEEMRADPDISLWARSVSDNFQAYLSVPLVVKDEIYGGISFFYTDHQEFAEESVNLAVALSDQVALAIENARLREQAEEAAVVAERNRLARDLHDAVSQTLFSASIIAEVLPRIWERNPEEGNRRLDELRQLTRGALAEMRMLLVELRPAALLETELGDLLHHLTEAFTGKTRVPVRLQVNGSCTLPPDTQVAFYRVAQEALNNIAKHANASQVWVTLDCEVPTVNLMIRDDGRGFDPSQIPSDHFGVQIMHERAASIGATLTLTSAPNEGTEVVIRWSP